MERKGLTVDVYTTDGDCTNGGVTSRFKEFVLIGEGVSGPFTPDAKTPALRLVKQKFSFGERVRAEPVCERPEGCGGPMFGGNFIYTSDSRFHDATGLSGPIPVHDRFEIPVSERTKKLPAFKVNADGSITYDKRGAK